MRERERVRKIERVGERQREFEGMRWKRKESEKVCARERGCERG